jgi:uncharacterized protein YkwD
MPGTPPLGPAALSRVHVPTPPARRSIAPLVRAALAAAVIALAAVPAGARAAACPSADQPVGTAPAASVEAAVACLVNGERTSRGLVAVDRAAALETAAQRHAADMVARRYFAHVSPTGGTVDKRARRAGYLTAPCWAVGEDLGWAPPDLATARGVVDAWMDSPSHRGVILDRSFRDIGIGLVDRAPVGDAAGATFVLELGALTACERGAGESPRATPRARVRVS